MWRLASFFYIYIYSKTNLSSDLYNSTIQSLYITSLFSLTSSDWLAFWSLCFTSLLFSSSHTIYLSSFFLKYSLSGTSSLLQVQGATYLLFFSFLFFPFNRDSFNLLFRVFLPRFSHYFFLSPSQFSLQFIHSLSYFVFLRATSIIQNSVIALCFDHSVLSSSIKRSAVVMINDDYGVCYYRDWHGLDRSYFIIILNGFEYKCFFFHFANP